MPKYHSFCSHFPVYCNDVGIDHKVLSYSYSTIAGRLFKDKLTPLDEALLGNIQFSHTNMYIPT